MPAKSQPAGFARRVTIFYCRSCHALFGKTISVMAGEAEAAGRWYGAPGAALIDWLLREPDHCASQLIYYRRARRLDVSIGLVARD
jgi:hypothetical protein